MIWPLHPRNWVRLALLLLVWLLSASPLVAQSYLSHRRLAAQDSSSDLAAKPPASPGAAAALPFAQEPTTPRLGQGLSYSQAGLAKIKEMIQKGETSLALASLERLPTQAEAGEDERILKETKNLLTLEAAFQLGVDQRAIAEGRKYLKDFPDGKERTRAFYLFSLALARQKLPLEETQLFSLDQLEQLSLGQAAALREALITDAVAKRKFSTAFSYLEAEEGKLIPGFERWAALIIERLEDLGDLDEILENFSQAELAQMLYEKKVQLYTRQGRYQEADDYLDQLLGSTNQTSRLYAELLALKRYVADTKSINPYKIGVILPISHKRFKSLAEQVMEGLELGLKEFSKGGRPFQLVFKDSNLELSKQDELKMSPNLRRKKTHEHVQKLVRELAEEDKVIAILGPLAKETSLAAGQAAGRQRLPVISFSLTEEVGRDLPYLFRFQRSPTQESITLVDYAMDYLGSKRFVVFYNPTKTGIALMQAFGNRVEARGGQIVGVSAVDRSQMDFQDNYLSMTGGYRQISEEEQKELEQTRERLEPEVDFDAVFAPFDPATLSLIGSFNSLFKADQAWILAGNQANVRENQLLEGSLRLRFVDSFPISNVSTYLQPFFEAHWQAFNYKGRYRPPTAYTIYGYEALEILAGLLANPANHHRESLTLALNGLEDFSLLTGQVSHLGEGELAKDIKVLKLDGKNTVEVFESK